MKRRDFIAAAAVGTAAGAFVSEAVSAKEAGRELIDIRTFWAPDAQSRQDLIDKIDELLVPNRKKFGFGKTGVLFTDLEKNTDKNFDPKYHQAVFVVTSAPDFAKLEAWHDKLYTGLDKAQMLNKSTKESVYFEMEAALLRAFPHFPTLQVPTLSPDRVLQYRCYFSPNPDRCFAKRNMFDVRGELTLFQKCGMSPVFFGEMLYGNMMPNISYMLSFKNEDARTNGWDQFRNADEWKVMKVEKEFEDTATRIRNLVLRPSKNSQI